jgi:hypothetical protein
MGVKMGPEKKFENQVKKWLTDNGIYEAGYPRQKMVLEPAGWFFKVWGGGFQRAGIPDVIINIKGYFLAVELKGDDGKPTELQIANTERINESDGVAIILYPSDFTNFKALVGALLADKWFRARAISKEINKRWQKWHV